jgi:hypothetical protein
MDKKKGGSDGQKKAKILMLHGYRQNEAVFRERTGGLRKMLKSCAEFIFIDAPHLIPIEEEGGQDDNNDRGWWFSQSNKCYKALEKTDCDFGFDETLKYIDSIFETKGPFDGIFTFSQVILIYINNNSNNYLKLIFIKRVLVWVEFYVQ